MKKSNRKQTGFRFDISLIIRLKQKALDMRINAEDLINSILWKSLKEKEKKTDLK